MTNRGTSPVFLASSCTLIALIAVALLGATQSASAQTYTIIHNFTGQEDGGAPFAGLVL